MNDQKRDTRAALISLIFSLVLLIVYGFALWYTDQKILASSTRNIVNATQSGASSYSKMIRSDVNSLKAESTDFQRIAYSGKNTGISDALKDVFNSSSSGFSSLCFVTSDGKYYLDNGGSGTMTSAEYDSLAKSSGNVSVLPSSAAKKAGGTICITTGSVNFGGTSGILAGIYTSDDIFGNTLRSLYGGAGYGFITDSSGKLITSSVSSSKFPYTDFYSVLSKSASNKNITPRIKSDLSSGKSGNCVVALDSKSYIVTYQLISKSSGWYMITSVPKSVAFEEMGYLVTITLLVGALFIFCITAIANSYGRSIRRNHTNMMKIAYDDPVTGYRNFAKFKNDAEEMLGDNPDTVYYFYTMNMVGFRYINDAFGYDIGDKILKEIGQSIYDLLSEGEIFARVSADRFVILAKRRFDKVENDSFLYLLVDRISKIQPLSSSHIRLEVQMGLYIVDEEARRDLSMNAMYDRALIALSSISHSDTAIAVYDSSMHEDQIERKVIESKMHMALENGEFHVYVQPKYKTADGTLAAGEALIRWYDPEKGVVPPVKFIPLFEKNRFVHDIDLYVMEVICRFMRMRLNADRPVVTVSLNVSPVEMTMPGFLDSYISIKEKYEIPDDLIELEFTEGIFFENEKLFKDTISTLKSHGFSCSLDDFGSGYSSLNVLKEMPVDVLKLDKLFFKESGDITRDRSVIRSVVAMARSLNIKTVAEGVETLDTVEFLKLIGCTMIQGYVFARPMPLTEFEQLMDNETISTLGASDLGLDKYSEIIPLDKPYDLSIRQSYQMIFEINTNGDLYHVYKQDGCKLKAEALPERGSYHSLIGKYLPAVIHPSDIRRVSDVLAPASLKKYFESSRELDLEYREITLDSQYIWVKLHIIRAQGTQLNNLILFGYISDINDVKRQEESLLATESRFSSAFIGISGIVGEYDFTTGKVIVLEKTNSTLSILNKINDYDTIVQFGAENLVHKEHVNRLLDTCSTEKIKEAFLVKKEKTLSIKILARPSRKVDFYNWYEITYYMQPNNPNKLLVTVQDITSREKEEFNEKTLLDMNRLALCKTFDEIMEIDLNNDTYKLTLIVNKEDGEERVSEGKYSTLFEAMCKYLFPPDDTELMDSLLSINALRSFYKDSELSEMSTNIRRHEKFSASGEDPYLWYNIMILAANKNLEYADPVVYVYIKNIQAEKTSEHELLDYVRRLSRSVSLYLYVYEFSIDERTVTVLGGKNVAGDVSTLKNIPYSEYIDSLADEAVAEEDRTIFEELCEPETLKSYFETEGDEFSCSVRSRKNKGSSLKITQLFDSRERIVTVLISEMN